MKHVKTFLCALLCVVLLLSAAVVGTSALSADVNADTWGTLELKALYPSMPGPKTLCGVGAGT